MVKRTIITLLVGLIGCLGVLGQGNSSGKPLKVRAIYPAGSEVVTSDRITVEFNQNVVALGASMFVDDVVPIDIEPAVECEWNWVKLNTLQCDLPIDSDLDVATSYTVTVRRGIKAPNGQLMDKVYVHTFETISPMITYAGLESWKSHTEPIVDVNFNQKVSLDSLKNRLFLYDSASGREIPIKICPDHWSRSSDLRADRFGRQKAYQIFDSAGCDIVGKHDDSVLVLPQAPLSQNSKVAVLLLPGLEGANGNLTSAERVLFDTEITTFDDFRLLGLVCQDVYGQDVLHTTSQMTSETCAVLSDFSVHFSSPISESKTIKLSQVQPQTPLEVSFWSAGSYSSRGYDGFMYRFRGELQSNTSYRVHLSVAEQSNDESVNPPQLQDVFGRSLVGPTEITFRTDRPLPVARVNKPKVVVDSNGTVEPQISMGNVDDVTIVYDILDELGVQNNQKRTWHSPEQDHVLLTQPLDLRNALRTPSGVMTGTVVSSPRFEHPEETLESIFFAQATPYSVYLKLGTTNTLVWVVDLQTGEPIANADVEFYLGNPSNLAENSDSIFSGTTDTSGLVSLPGYESFDPNWNRTEYDFYDECQETRDCPMYLLRVKGEAGIALLPLDYDYKLTGSIWPDSIFENLDHWATTPQNLYLPGDTVHIKGFVRTRRNEVRVIPDEGHYGLCISGPRERTFEVTPISLNEFGSYHASVKLNKRIELGEYEIQLVFDANEPLSAPCTDRYQREYTYWVTGGSFVVFQFKTNPIRVTQHLDAKFYEHGDRMTINTQAKLHAGGSYAHANGWVNVEIKKVKPTFESLPDDDFEISNNPDEPYSRLLYQTGFELDDQGSNSSTTESLDSNVYRAELLVESSVVSDRGKSVATRSSTPFWGVDQFVGIGYPEIYNSHFSGGYGRVKVGELWPITVMTVSKDDQIVIGKEVQITVYARQGDPDTRPSFDGEWEKIFDCEVVSEADPIFCEFIPPEENTYRVEAQIVDTKGNIQRSSILLQSYIDNRPEQDPKESPKRIQMELICGSEQVSVGDTIRCEVENHLGSSPMLITIERTSVIDEWLVRLDADNPIIEFTVLEDYQPRFELSVLAVSPRKESIEPRDTLYRIASKEFTVENPRLPPLELSVASNREVYSPRDTVKLSITVDQHKNHTQPIEFAMAVVDEALLDLSPTKDSYFDPTQKIWVLDQSWVYTYSLIKALMEKSVLPPSTPSPYWDRSPNPFRSSSYSSFSTGTYMPVSDITSQFGVDSDSDPSIRDIDRFVAYWNPSVVSDNGRLKLDFVLPDNLTSWKVLVMAVSSDDRFGFTSSTFSTWKDTEVRAVVPNVVTEGDKFQIGASILNRADRRRKIKVELRRSGLLGDESSKEYKQLVEFEPNERKVVMWDVIAGSLPQSRDPRQPLKTSEIQVVASAGDRRDQDALAVRIPVRSNRVRVSSVVYGTLEAEKTKIPIGIPGKLANENGLLDVTLTTNEAVNFDGVFQYAIEYPYSCWEQELTKAILAMQYVQLEKRGVKHGTEWRDPEGLIARVLAIAVDYQVPNGGMAYFTPKYQFEDPYLSAYTAIAFSWLEDAGYSVPVKVKRKLIEYLQKFIKNEEEVLTFGVYQSDDFVLDHLEATVGAVVVHALAVSGELTENELAHYSAHINQMDLFGLSQYLLASLTLDPTHSLNRQTFERIMNHRSLVDGAVEFVESVPRGFTQILHSDTRSLCSILDALTSLSKVSSVEIDKGEMHELSIAVRYARESLPYWQNTQDNVFCTNALIKYVDFIDSDIEDFVATVNLRSNQTDLSTRLAEEWRFNSQVTRLHAQHTLQPQTFGSHGAIEIVRQGRGTAFFNVEFSYLTSVDERINRYSGFEVHREYVAYRDKKWQILKPGDHINKGEHVLVNLYLNNKFDRHHVMVDDTVPGGLEPVNMNLATEFIPPFDKYELQRILWTSELYQEFKEASSWRFHYRELGLQNVRFFANSITRRKYHLMWLGQAISAGEFTVLPTHVEEMYRPIMFGKSEPWVFKIEPNKQAVVNFE